MRPFLCCLMSLPLWAAPCTNAAKSCMERVTVDGRYIEVYRTHPLDATDAAVTRAFILVHGTQRNGDDYYKTAVTATREAGALSGTLVIAPQFRANDGRSCKDALGVGELGFSCNGWKDGDTALNGPVDSYAPMDALLLKLADKRHFPNLREIVLAGHSAGGQYVQRYAAVNRVESRVGLPVRYVVANPSSYLYLESWRPVAGDPPAGCATFDDYKYGLRHLTGYAAGTGVDTIKAQYPKRNVTYLLGERDTTDEHSMDTTCPAMAQGPNRFVRGMDYWKRLTVTFGARHEVHPVPGCDHNADCMYRSPVGRKTVFGR
jgi:pimeloyl-ACP methyl ester carboxylesterase